MNIILHTGAKRGQILKTFL